MREVLKPYPASYDMLREPFSFTFSFIFFTPFFIILPIDPRAFLVIDLDVLEPLFVPGMITDYRPNGVSGPRLILPRSGNIKFKF